jgi:hypothetical protein
MIAPATVKNGSRLGAWHTFIETGLLAKHGLRKLSNENIT